MKKWRFISYVTLVLGLALPSMGAEFEFHGDLNHRFLLYTNHHDWLNPERGVLNRGTINDSYGELKYRFWVEVSSNDGNTKGVYAIEIGGVRYGEPGSEKGEGGSFSGDAVNIETRWAYLDWQLPGVDTKARFVMGLQPFKVNYYLWQETAAGVVYNGAPNDILSYQLGWIRGIDKLTRDETSSNVQDQDNFLARFNFNAKDDTTIGIFALYQFGDPDDAGTIYSRDYEIKQFAEDVDFDMLTIGLDGGTQFGNWFVNWDLMYQNGNFDDVTFIDGFDDGTVVNEFSLTSRTGDFDLSAYFAHVDVGVNMGRSKITGTVWYASGDDNPNDGDFDAFLVTDLDIDDNIGIFEGVYTNDNTYFTDKPYMLDKGFLIFKLGLDHEATQKVKYGAAIMYMMTAEDIDYFDFLGRPQSESDIGFELDAYLKYMIYKNLEFAINAGYLLAGDALDAFEQGTIQDGSADENIWASSLSIRYKF
jgi:hypothetical protein